MSGMRKWVEAEIVFRVILFFEVENTEQWWRNKTQSSTTRAWWFVGKTVRDEIC